MYTNDVQFILYSTTIILTTAFTVYFFYIALSERKKTQERIMRVTSKLEKEAEKTRPVWDVAQTNLDGYFNRNIALVTAIFWLSVSVMFIGFGMIIWGIAQAIQSSSSTIPAVVSSLAGIITEMVGAIFLFMYRSTMQQAIGFTGTLERMNSIGIAMQILDTIPEDAKAGNLKHSTKVAVIETLMHKTFSEVKQNIKYSKEGGK